MALTAAARRSRSGRRARFGAVAGAVGVRAVGIGALALALAGCRGQGRGNGAPAAWRDAGDAGLVADATASTATGGAGAAGPPGPATVTIKVHWPDAPASARASPGYTPCHTPRPPRARVHTLHGVAGAMVVLEGGPAGAAAAPPARDLRLTVRDCALEPVAALARPGAAVEVQSQDGAHVIVVEHLGQPWQGGDGAPRAERLARAHLPVVGHTAAVTVDAPGAIRISADRADVAWVLVAPHAHAGISDEIGAVALGEVPPGRYRAIAWLPPAAGQPAVGGSAEVVVAGGGAVEAIVTLAPAP